MRDKGLQAERTALAWMRTVLTWCACVLLLFRMAWLTDRPETLWAVSLLAGCAIPMTTVCLLRARHLKQASVPKRIHPAVPMALAGCCMVAALLALWARI